ncbi:hypothetical protein CMQ_176 [Grosmannia clavigera kw1407]|uniref:Uncharacterized protein n=1 Tax=Grosmannia clavigera (strain kw1407 / UAMH 11150) TaxID=655863 RepID=F0XQU1_GROCL|nr:uncharacterized protein CMQ_176 [Grosmannia clavigera kw1407]EFW99858.1 hypothetical protein CMQ_176 [Grosmannia clavigera kw1407]
MSDNDHLSYDRTTDTLVRQTRSFLYNDVGDQSLYKIVDIHFLGFEWIPLASWENDSQQTNSYEQTYTSQFRIRTGQDVNNTWDFGSTFKNLTLNVGSSTRTITEQELTATKSYTATTKVEPRSSVHLYQKRYYFKTFVWFKLDAWNQLWTVGNWQAPGIAQKIGEVEVDANEYLTKPFALSGSGSLPVAGGSDVWAQDNIKQFELCPRKCQDYLHDRGV